jgi:hypothetical protein
MGLARAALGQAHREPHGGYAGEDPRDDEAAELAELHLRLSKRRLEALAVARTMNAAEVDAGALETFEPAELQHVN